MSKYFTADELVGVSIFPSPGTPKAFYFQWQYGDSPPITYAKDLTHVWFPTVADIQKVVEKVMAERTLK